MSEANNERTSEDIQHRSPLPLLAAFFGLFVICLGFFTLNLSVGTLLLWLTQSDYVRTELKVTGLSLTSGEGLVLGTISSTEEEIHSYHVPKELYEFDSPSDPSGSLMKSTDAVGKVIPLWYAKNHDSIFSPAKIQYVSEYPTLPGLVEVVTIWSVNAAIFAVGFFITRWSFRQSLARMAELEKSGNINTP